MNRNEFVRFANSETGITMTQINSAIDIFTQSVIAAMSAGHDVKLVGFGTFKLKKRAARVGQNPKTKERVEIPERNMPVFEPGDNMKSAVMNNKQYIQPHNPSTRC